MTHVSYIPHIIPNALTKPIIKVNHLNHAHLVERLTKIHKKEMPFKSQQSGHPERSMTIQRSLLHIHENILN